MSWSIPTLIALGILAAANSLGVRAEEQLTGVVSEFATEDQSAITHVAISSDQDIFLGKAQGEILRWNPKTKVISTWRKSPQGSSLANLQTTGDGSVLMHAGQILEITSAANEIQRIELPRLSHLAISPEGGQLAAIAMEPPIVFLDPQSGKMTHRVDRQVNVDQLLYSPKGDYLASSTRYGTLYLWNAQSGVLVWKSRLEGDLKGVAFSPDQSMIFASYGAEGIWVIDIKTGNLLHRYPRPHAFPKQDLPHRMAVSSDGTLLAVTVVPDRVEIWESFTGRPILLLPKHPGTITDVEFLPDGVHLASADESGRAYVWDLSAAEFAARFDVANPYSEDQLRQLWRMLGEPDGHAAWSAMVALKHRPEQALALILDPPDDELLIKQLIQRLDDDEFSVRDAAFRALRQLSLHAEPFLHNTLNTSRSAEVKVRVRRLLSYLAGPRREVQLQVLKEAQTHRDMRVVQLLKWIGTEDAMKRLETLRESAKLLAIRRQAELALKFLAGKRSR